MVHSNKIGRILPERWYLTGSYFIKFLVVLPVQLGGPAEQSRPYWSSFKIVCGVIVCNYGITLAQEDTIEINVYCSSQLISVFSYDLYPAAA